MSSGADCYFTEVEPGKWTYWLQDWPYGETEDGQTYGPFNGHAAAVKDLSDNHQNPGGWSSNPLPESQHVHEWEKGAYVDAGVTLTIDVHSLGPDPLTEAVVAYVQSLPVDHPAFRVRPSGLRWSDDVERCSGCGRRR